LILVLLSCVLCLTTWRMLKKGIQKRKEEIKAAAEQESEESPLLKVCCWSLTFVITVIVGGSLPFRKSLDAIIVFRVHNQHHLQRHLWYTPLTFFFSSDPHFRDQLQSIWNLFNLKKNLPGDSFPFAMCSCLY
jgi:hypothetical protein